MINHDLNQELYSIIIKPSSEVINEVKVLKDKLASRIGNYASRNSEAHISIIEFPATPHELKIFLEIITPFCSTTSPKMVIFDNLICSNKSKTIFLAPHNRFKNYLKSILIKFSNDHYGYDAHLSIGRNLKTEDLNIARKLFDKVELKFMCNTIAVRKFNFSRKQYDIIKEIHLTGNNELADQLECFN